MSKFNPRAVDHAQVNLAAAAIAMAQNAWADGKLKDHSENGQLSAAMISTESFESSALRTQVEGTMQDLIDSCTNFARGSKVLSMIGAKRGQDGQLEADMQSHTHQHAMQAVGYALASAMNPRAHLTRQGNKQAGVTKAWNDVFSPDSGGIDPSKLGKATVESYDTKPNEDIMKLTAAYALATSTQNSFAELFFGTVNLAPDEYALSMEIPLIGVYDEVRYDMENVLTDFHRRNIVNAEIDHTILKNNMLLIVPVYRAETADSFVDTNLVAPRVIDTENGPVNTAPLAVGIRTSLFRVSQTDAMIAKGALDQTDALDTNVLLKAFYIAFQSADGATKEVVRVEAEGMGMIQFLQAPQGLTRTMQLNFTTDNVQIGKNTALHNQATSTLLTAFQGPTANTAFLSLSIRGDVNLQDSAIEVTPSKVQLNTIRNAAGESLTLKDPANAALVNVFKGAEVIAFEVDARKVNSNLRELGQLVDFNTFRMSYGVKLGSPLSVQRPITNGDSQDALHAAALSYLCKVRQSNEAVTTLLGEVQTLRGYQKRNDYIARQPEFLGISSYLVEPTLDEVELDLLVIPQTVAQHERYADITSLITDTTKIVSYKLWQLSNWQAAANLFEGTEAPLPKVIIGTDLATAQYVNVVGDTRTVGPDFTYAKAMSPDKRIRDMIFIAFNFPTSQPGVPHPLNHGMMLNKPEVVAALNLSRSSHSRELIVHPSFRHIWLTPILGVIYVKNLKEALTRKATLQVGGDLVVGQAEGAPGSSEDNPLHTKEAA